MRVLAQPAFKDRNDNPYTWLLYTHMAALGVDVDEFSPRRLLQNNYIIWHRHWPERNLNDTNVLRAIAKTQALLLLMKSVRSRGVKIVWSVHNLSAHERLYPQLEAWFWKAFIRQLDGYISLSKSSMEAAQQRFPELRKLPGFVIYHGHYRAEYPADISSQAARASLGISPAAKVLLFFGKIRPYKNAPELIKAFRQFPDPNSRLYIVDSPEFPTLAEAIKQEAALDTRVHIYLDFISKDKAQIYFHAADLVILPYSEILNSGSALLALSFNRPILVPLRGSLAELQYQVGEEWVRTYAGEINSLQIEAALKWALSTPRPAQAPLGAFDWKELAHRTIDAYHAIAARKGNRL